MCAPVQTKNIRETLIDSFNAIMKRDGLETSSHPAITTWSLGKSPFSAAFESHLVITTPIRSKIENRLQNWLNMWTA